VLIELFSLAVTAEALRAKIHRVSEKNLRQLSFCSMSVEYEPISVKI